MDLALLKTLVPMNTLTDQNLELLAGAAKPETLPLGTHLFTQGDTDGLSIYLLSGEVMLTTSDLGRPRNIIGGTQSSRFPLSQLKPRQYSCLAITPVTILRIDSQLIENLIIREKPADYEITEFESGEDLDWLTQLFHSETFQKLPIGNVNALFPRIHPIRVKSGQIIIRQGDPGYYYYLVKSGMADVLSKNEREHKVSVIDQVNSGDGFGEDALMTNTPCNATFVMTTDGVLLRLSRKVFDALLREPMVNWLDLEAARSQVKAGAGLVDVRLEDEFRQGTIKGSVNFPLHILRKKMKELDSARPYIVFCQTGIRSGAAAFLLTQRGYQVSALRGGMDGLKPRPA